MKSAINSWFVSGLCLAALIMSIWPDWSPPLLMLSVIGNAIAMGLWDINQRLRIVEGKLAAKETAPSAHS
jgi:hypothetical protein